MDRGLLAVKGSEFKLERRQDYQLQNEKLVISHHLVYSSLKPKQSFQLAKNVCCYIPVIVFLLPGT